jgi:hypothetical protein
LYLTPLGHMGERCVEHKFGGCQSLRPVPQAMNCGSRQGCDKGSFTSVGDSQLAQITHHALQRVRGPSGPERHCGVTHVAQLAQRNARPGFRAGSLMAANGW